MCHKKIYYNTYADGSQDVTEKVYSCREGGRVCPRPDVRQFDRKLNFTKLNGLREPETPRSLAERKPTPYSHMPPTPDLSSSPSPHKRGVYVNGKRVVELSKMKNRRPKYGSANVVDAEPHNHAPAEPHHRLKRSSTMPHYVVIEQEDRGRPASRSRDVPIGPVHVINDRHRQRSSSSDRHRHPHHRRHSSRDMDSWHRDPRHHHNPDHDVVVIDDEAEQRRQRREKQKRRTSMSGALPTPAVKVVPPAPPEPPRPDRYTPRRASTVIHGSPSSGYMSGGSGESGPSKTSSKTSYGSGFGLGSRYEVTRRETAAKKHGVQWEDELQRKRDQQNAEIAARPTPPGTPPHPRGILKNPQGSRTRRYSDADEVERLRRAVERMDLPGDGGSRERRRDGSRERRRPSREGRERERSRDRGRDRDEYGRFTTKGDWDRRDRDGGSREEGRRGGRSRVWVDGDRYRYL